MIERRSLTRGIDNTSENGVKGYFAKFNTKSQDLGGFVETLASGCFADSLRDHPDVLGLADHDSAKVLGRTSSNTMSVREDNVGLAFDIPNLPNTTYANDLKESLKRGDITGCSFGFYTDDDHWEVLADGTVLRTVLKATLFEGSIVSMPAYLDTDANLRSLDKKTDEELRAKYASKIAEVRSAQAAQITQETPAVSEENKPVETPVEPSVAETVVEPVAQPVETVTLPEAKDAADRDAQIAALEVQIAALRAITFEKRDFLDEDDSVGNSAGCECSCVRCIGDDCDNCEGTDCSDDSCLNCPMQDAERARVAAEAEERAKLELEDQNALDRIALALRRQF